VQKMQATPDCLHRPNKSLLTQLQLFIQFKETAEKSCDNAHPCQMVLTQCCWIRHELLS